MSVYCMEGSVKHGEAGLPHLGQEATPLSLHWLVDLFQCRRITVLYCTYNSKTSGALHFHLHLHLHSFYFGTSRVMSTVSIQQLNRRDQAWTGHWNIVPASRPFGSLRSSEILWSYFTCAQKLWQAILVFLMLPFRFQSQQPSISALATGTTCLEEAGR